MKPDATRRKAIFAYIDEHPTAPPAEIARRFGFGPGNPADVVLAPWRTWDGATWSVTPAPPKKGPFGRPLGWTPPPKPEEPPPAPRNEAEEMLARINALPEDLRGPLLERLITTTTLAAAQAPKHRLLTFVEQTSPGYLSGWFHRDVCERLEAFSRAVTEGKSPRLILSAPPRGGKSKIVSRRFPVWHLGHNSTHEIICCSYGQDLANKASIEARGVATESVKTWPHLARQKERAWGTEFWQIAGGGSYQAVGMGGPITGMGAHVAIIDDYVKSAEEAASSTLRDRDREWYRTTLRTRLAPGGGIIVIATRWTHDDLIGWLTDESEEGHEQWEVINYPALAEEDEPHRKEGEALHPERFDEKALAAIRGAVGERVWAALYQGHPSPAEGALFRRDWLAGRYDGDPQRIIWDDVMISVDATFGSKKASADFNALVVIGRLGPDFCIIDIVNKRLTLPELVDELRMLCRLHPQAVTKLVERAGNGDALIQTLESEIPGIVGIRTGRADKESRANRILGYFRAGNVKWPEARYAPWLGVAIEQMATFPLGSHDDIVDAITMALGHWVVPNSALQRQQGMLRLVNGLW